VPTYFVSSVLKIFFFSFTILNLRFIYSNCWTYKSHLQYLHSCIKLLRLKLFTSSVLIRQTQHLFQVHFFMLLCFKAPWEFTSQFKFEFCHLRFNCFWLAVFSYANPLFQKEIYFIFIYTSLIYTHIFSKATRAYSKNSMCSKYKVVLSLWCFNSYSTLMSY
jgi:hypothetical protein